MEYEILGLVAIITGLFSVQIKMTRDHIMEKLDHEVKESRKIHEKLCDQITQTRCKHD